MQRDCFQMNHEDQRLNYPSNKPKAMVDRQDLPHWSSSLLLHDHLDDDYKHTQAQIPQLLPLSAALCGSP